MILTVLNLVAAIVSGAIAVRVVFDDRPMWAMAAINLLVCLVNAALFVMKAVPA